MSRTAKGAVLSLLLVVAGSIAGMSAGSTPVPVAPRAPLVRSVAQPIIDIVELQSAVVSANRAQLVQLAASRDAARPYLGQFEVTCYALKGHTYTGRRVSTDVVAVDPRVVPLGTRLYIAGVGVRVAEDTGRLIKGHRLDVWLPTTKACMQFGRRPMAVYRA